MSAIVMSLDSLVAACQVDTRAPVRLFNGTQKEQPIVTQLRTHVKGFVCAEDSCSVSGLSRPGERAHSAFSAAFASFQYPSSSLGERSRSSRPVAFTAASTC